MWCTGRCARERCIQAETNAMGVGLGDEGRERAKEREAAKEIRKEIG